MLKILFTEFWAALLPVAIYLLWRALKKRKGHEVPPLSAWGPWFWVVVATLVVLIISFVIFGLSSGAGGSIYEPTVYRDGELIRGKVE